MWRWVLGVGTVALAATPAVAQLSDDWSGPYVGILGGLDWSSAKGDYTGASGGGGEGGEGGPPPVVHYDFNAKDTDLSFGGTLGFNFQMGPVVFGPEGDFMLVTGNGARVADPGGSGHYDRIDNQWLAHLRGRVGFDLGGILAYVAGGGAFANIQAQHFSPDNGGQRFSETSVRSGYSLGGGVEGNLGQGWGWRIEYLRDHIGNHDYDFVPGVHYSDSDFTANSIRIGIIWRP
ncbi:MAG TPA: outer membrane beta-barrel protein [Rhizomicrobium sp.]|nr:outer membrane beta-barrel protein [Rhizomicrobium sp.]